MLMIETSRAGIYDPLSCAVAKDGWTVAIGACVFG
jgi:hypothetical protein